MLDNWGRSFQTSHTMTAPRWITVAVFSIAAEFLFAADIAPAKQGADLLKTDIMGIFAHPDDETGMAATLAYYSHGRGSVVASIYCTRGEGGGNMVGTHWGPSLGVLREAELRDGLSTLGVRYCYFLDQVDWDYTESASMTLQKWDREEALRRLVRLVRALRPDVIVTMNPTPRPGQHGHHQSAGILATEAATAAADPSRFPDQIVSEGLGAWQVRKLYYTGTGPGIQAAIQVTDSLTNGTTPAEIAGLALANHRSQAFGNFSRAAWLRRPQVFTLIKSAVPWVQEESDLLRGLPIENPRTPFAAEEQDRPKSMPVSLVFRPRPAIVRFREWALAQGIPQMAESLTSDIPVVAGESNAIQLEIENRTSAPVSGVVRFSFRQKPHPPGEVALPRNPDIRAAQQHSPTEKGRQVPDSQPTAVEAILDSWTVTPGISECRIPANGRIVITLDIAPPSDALEEASVTASGEFAGVTHEAVARLHPVPKTLVPKLETPPILTRFDESWRALPVHLVTRSDLVQGRVIDSTDSQAEFRLAHDGRNLYAAVEVSDESVVSNIAPNDIRGHWRSDSVEICIDPNPGSEHTLGCFKLGIFPFDTAGTVRAARDADANQGPVEVTAPGTRIHSERTPTGYRILAAIPFSEIGFDPRNTRRLGFNLIIYDGDKADAAIGENINESRIAWASHSGVQGRPEDWGRLDLE